MIFLPTTALFFTLYHYKTCTLAHLSTCFNLNVFLKAFYCIGLTQLFLHARPETHAASSASSLGGGKSARDAACLCTSSWASAGRRRTRAALRLYCNSAMLASVKLACSTSKLRRKVLQSLNWCRRCSQMEEALFQCRTCSRHHIQKHHLCVFIPRRWHI